MGSTESKAVIQAVRATTLPPLPAPVPILDSRYCLNETRRTFLVQHKTSGGEMTVRVYDYTAEKKGARVYRMHGSQIYFTVDGADDSESIVRVRPSGQSKFSVELPTPTSSRETPKRLYTLKRVLKDNDPAAVGVVKDLLTGQTYRLGYTGVWRYAAVIWLASEKTADCRVPIAKTYPSGRVGIHYSYCLEVVDGVDVAALMSMITVMDMGVFESSGGLGVGLGVMDG